MDSFVAEISCLIFYRNWLYMDYIVFFTFFEYSSQRYSDQILLSYILAEVSINHKANIKVV